MKRLVELWPATPVAHADIMVSALVLDSRQLRPGMAFVALKGQQRDGRDFIDAVIAAGAVAVLAEQDAALPQHEIRQGIPVLSIADLAQQLGVIAARFFDQPSSAQTVFAVTGTNGKTSVAHFIAAAQQHLGNKSALLGTLGNGLYGALEKSTHTTPDACQLQAWLAQFRAQGASHVALEASSHGLEQGRLNGTAIKVAVFTNLSRDHLDYHGDMEQYAAAKEILFRWPGLAAAVLNADDAAAVRYRAVLAPELRVLTYSLYGDSAADVRVLDLQPSLTGMILTVSTPAGDCALQLPLLGRFNASNVLAVLSALLVCDIPLADISEALRHMRPVPGRMECFAGEHPTVVVDYAHTPDALEKVLSALREHVESELVCVFGCGGDRDRGKRALMGEVAVRLADRVIITSDNPRSEHPEAIVADILVGAGETAKVELDRREAIAAAIAAAGRHDIVLIAGKGHEDYQEVVGVRHPFSDVEEVHMALRQWRAA